MTTPADPSPSSGDPKGVMISHASVLATISGVLVKLEELGEKLGPDDVYLSFLPLAHIFDRWVKRSIDRLPAA